MLFRTQLRRQQKARLRLSAVCVIALYLIAGVSFARWVSASIAEHSTLTLTLDPVTELIGNSRNSESLKMSIPDEELLDQNGRAVHLYGDLIKGKVVVVSFMFTSCGLVCPMQTVALSKLQRALGDRFGNEVHFVSVSLDPETDNPKRLKDWAVQFGANAGWTFVTGEKTRIDKVARAFTGGPAEKGDHSTAIFIGNDSTKVWLRVDGLADTERLIEMIDQVSGHSK